MDAFLSSLRQSIKNLTNIKALDSFKVKCEEEEEAPELVDPQETIREECKEHHCEKYVAKLESCNDRVNSRTKTAETCFEELLDLFHCVDHCASQKLFAQLK